MPQLSRYGDVDTGKGKILRGAATVFANGIPVGLNVSAISHKGARTTAGSPTVFAEGCQVLRVTSPVSDKHSIVQGSPDIFCP